MSRPPPRPRLSFPPPDPAALISGSEKAAKAAAKEEAKAKRAEAKAAKELAKGPKKPLSAYLFFTQTNRSVVQAANPDATKLGDVAKLLGDKWKSMTEEERQPCAPTLRSQPEFSIRWRPHPRSVCRRG